VRKLRGRAKHKIYHIPLDLSVQSLARPGKLLSMRRSAGHIHYFSRDTALALLEDTGHRVIDWCYTSGATELGTSSWKARLMKGPRNLLFRTNPDAAARWLGGYSILALTEPDREELPDASGSENGNRVLSLEERSRLTPEAYGYLLGVRGNGAIDEEQFEWVLERALASGERSVGLDEMQDLVLEAALGGRGGGGDRGDFPGVH